MVQHQEVASKFSQVSSATQFLVSQPKFLQDCFFCIINFLIAGTRQTSLAVATRGGVSITFLFAPYTIFFSGQHQLEEPFIDIAEIRWSPPLLSILCRVSGKEKIPHVCCSQDFLNSTIYLSLVSESIRYALSSLSTFVDFVFLVSTSYLSCLRDTVEALGLSHQSTVAISNIVNIFYHQCINIKRSCLAWHLL